MTKVNPSRRRRLSELYLRGKTVEVDDGEGAVEVYIQKLSPTEHREAMSKAHAARARIQAVRKANDNDEQRMAFMTEAEFDGLFTNRELMIDYLTAEDALRLRQSAELELAATDEWSKNDYLEGLREAWNTGVRERYESDEEDAEADQIYSELERFFNEVEKKSERARRSLRRDFVDVHEEDLKSRVLDLLIEQEADAAWIDTFQRAQLLYAVRDPDDHAAHYFESLDELGFIDPRVLGELSAALQEITVEQAEGKDSEETPSS
jgi:hypothetical protein